MAMVLGVSRARVDASRVARENEGDIDGSNVCTLAVDDGVVVSGASSSGLCGVAVTGFVGASRGLKDVGHAANDTMTGDKNRYLYLWTWSVWQPERS